MTVSRRTFLRTTSIATASASAGALLANSGIAQAQTATGSLQPLLGTLTGNGQTATGSSQALEIITELGAQAGQTVQLPTDNGFLSVELDKARALGSQTPAVVKFHKADGTEETAQVTALDEARDGQSLTKLSEPVAIPSGTQQITLEGGQRIHLHNYAGVAPTTADGTPAAATETTGNTTDPKEPAAAAGGTATTGNTTTTTANTTQQDIQGSINNIKDDPEALASLAIGSLALGIGSYTSGLVPGVGGSANVIDGLNVISRAQWGANESIRNWSINFRPAQLITVHHTGMHASNATDYASQVRAIYNYHTTSANGGRGWGDIGYHLLIAPNGDVFQGRSTGVNGQAVFNPATLLGGQPHVVNGGHVYGANEGNIGVCLLGDFTTYAPTRAALDSLTRVIGHLCRGLGLDPRGHVRYGNSTRRAVSGHRDWADVSGGTACPGAMAYPLLNEVRDRA